MIKMNHARLMLSMMIIMFAVRIEGNVEFENGDNVHFGASSDAMIERFAQQNPQAAADYDEVFGDIRREMQKAEERQREEFDLIRHGKDLPKRSLPEYDMTSEEYETIQSFEKIRQEQEREMRARHQHQQQHQQYQHQHQHQQRHRESEEEMEARLRDEYMNRVHETPEAMEARLRAKIEREMMARKEEIAQRQWPQSKSKRQHKYCLPSPFHSVCDLNIFFTVLACVITGAFVVALVRNPQTMTKKVAKGAKTKKSE